MSGKPGRRFLTHEFQLRQADQMMCEGRLECCFFDLKRQRVTTPAAVGFPPGLHEEGWADVGRFRKLDRRPEGAAHVFDHTIRYCDIDNNGHMNNLRYVNLALDAFTRAELDEHPVRDYEIHFLNQCRELETVGVLRRDGAGDDGEGSASDLYVTQADGTVACRARIGF